MPSFTPRHTTHDTPVRAEKSMAPGEIPAEGVASLCHFEGSGVDGPGASEWITCALQGFHI
jgi:hypothetical protein